MMSNAKGAAYAVDCPVCNGTKGYRCIDGRDGTIMAIAHKRRASLARKQSPRILREGEVVRLPKSPWTSEVTSIRAEVSEHVAAHPDATLHSAAEAGRSARKQEDRMTDDAPRWHKTALALAALDTCPRLRRVLIDEGREAMALHCHDCGTAQQKSDADACSECGGANLYPVYSHPEMVHAIALDDSPAGLANIGPLLMALWKVAPDAQIEPPLKGASVALVSAVWGFKYIECVDLPEHTEAAPTAAEALALAFLLASR